MKPDPRTPKEGLEQGLSPAPEPQSATARRLLRYEQRQPSTPLSESELDEIVQLSEGSHWAIRMLVDEIDRLNFTAAKAPVDEAVRLARAALTEAGIFAGAKGNEAISTMCLDALSVLTAAKAPVDEAVCPYGCVDREIRAQPSMGRLSDYADCPHCKPSAPAPQAGELHIVDGKVFQGMTSFKGNASVAEVSAKPAPQADGALREAAEKAVKAYNEACRIEDIQGEDASETCEKCADPEDCQCDWGAAYWAHRKAFSELEAALRSTPPAGGEG